ncbi:hypothetical protein FB45DRAFT_799924, partial [Roridomyces roridus]
MSLSPASHLPDKFIIESPELRAAVESNTPIRFFPSGEPYIPLPAPHSQFYLGCERQSDLPDDAKLMNDLRLMRQMIGPPFPMPLINVQRYFVKQRAAVQALFAGYASGRWKPAASAPFDVIREIKEDGSEVYVGQATFGVDEHTKRTTPVPEGLEEWRIEAVCDIGAALNVEYHNRGIASAAVRTILNEWAVPQMGATEIHAGCFQSNTASAKLWEKHGFVEVPELRGSYKVPEVKGG